jgi:hypothetical protein
MILFAVAVGLILSPSPSGSLRWSAYRAIGAGAATLANLLPAPSAASGADAGEA